MSTKIVSTASEPLNGKISKKDLQKIHTDFVKHLKLGSDDKRQFKKKKGFFIDIDILDAFIQQAKASGPAYNKLLIQFGITLPDQKTCSAPYKNIANTLTITFLIADKKGKLKDKVGDGVLTAGFKASPVFTKKSAKLPLMGGGTGTGGGGDLNCCGNPHI